MALVQFEDLPSTNTPINASNLNNNFTECNNIIASGSNANGNYIKFSDGTMICYREISQSIDINNSWGSLYYGEDRTTYNFAQTFSAAPKVIVGLRPSSSIGCWLVFQDNVSITTSSYSGLYVARPNSANSVEVVFTILAIGKWN